MPTSTIPFEVLFEVSNDSPDATTLQSLRSDPDDEFESGGAIILLNAHESVSLVLNAGSTYHYVLKQNSRKAQILVKAWRDTQLKTTNIFEGQIQQDEYPMEGITIIPTSTTSNERH
ncbi:hypothetical protein HGRIS_007822 [Hohenbuehelia grisea]|uniref:Uncharacterized protein n=1 Tax=Hohenbuehelia grisea TaxID=104357 RepID=A0ABR3J623_9AGAR